MKRAVLFLLLALLSVGAQKPVARFGGVWSLDLKQSQGLPSAFNGVESFTMIVKQRPDSIVVAIQMTGAGQNVSLPVNVYRFNGPEVFREDTTRGTKRWMKAKWSGNGRTLTIVNRIESRTGGKEQRYTQTDTWRMAGKDVLRVTMTTKFKDSDSTRTQLRIFQRVK